MRANTPKGQEFKTGGVPAKDPTQETARWAWEDFRLGRGYPPEFEKMPPGQQLCYEAGRRAAASLSRFIPLPHWPPDVEITAILPPVLPEAAIKAFEAENLLTAKKYTGES